MAVRIVIMGTSGFGRVALDVLEAMCAAGEDLQIVGVVDDGPSDVNLARLADRDVAYLGTLDSWLTFGDYDTRYVLGVGQPAVRRQLVRQLDRVGLKPFTAVHPTANVGARTELAEGVVVGAAATISTNVRLSRHVHINPNATLGRDAVLENFVSVNAGAVISDHVLIGADALVGAGAIIRRNLSVGERALIGAGAVVTKDVPENVVVTGMPGDWGTVGAEAEFQSANSCFIRQ